MHLSYVHDNDKNPMHLSYMSQVMEMTIPFCVLPEWKANSESKPEDQIFTSTQKRSKGEGPYSCTE